MAERASQQVGSRSRAWKNILLPAPASCLIRINQSLSEIVVARCTRKPKSEGGNPHGLQDEIVKHHDVEVLAEATSLGFCAALKERERSVNIMLLES